MVCAVSIRNVSKVYKLYDRPLDRLKELLKLGKYSRDFWALRDINLDIYAGESVGIIGLNGSGKSTLLQIIAGTLEPTSGSVEIRGRIAALLELGIGFHPELTGRENIRMISSLMGVDMTKELEEEIISFAEIGDFINQPVRTYSSGMFVRLAFSLAVAVDPDILVIDEALSVGDYYFQKKSFDRIMEFKRKGKTLIFCSHSMYHINHLCSRAVWLHEGSIRMEGPADKVVLEYEAWIDSFSKQQYSQPAESLHNNSGASLEVILQNASGNSVRTGDPLAVDIVYKAPFDRCHIAVGFSKGMHSVIYATSTQIDGLPPLPGSGRIGWHIEELPLLPGKYEFSAALLDETGNVVIQRVFKELHVQPCKKEGPIGIVHVKGRWLET